MTLSFGKTTKYRATATLEQNCPACTSHLWPDWWFFLDPRTMNGVSTFVLNLSLPLIPPKMSQVWNQLFLQAWTDSFYCSQLFNTTVKKWFIRPVSVCPQRRNGDLAQSSRLCLEIAVNRVGGACLNLQNPLTFVIPSFPLRYLIRDDSQCLTLLESLILNS